MNNEFIKAEIERVGYYIKDLNLYFSKNIVPKELMGGTGFITAFNNYGIKTNDEINETNTIKLQSVLSKYNYMEAYSVYNGKYDEKGFVVFDVDYLTMFNLCHEFHQNAVIYIDTDFKIIYNLSLK